MRRAVSLVMYVAFAAIPTFMVAQASPAPITNSDIVNMTRSGIGEQTIVLAIRRGNVQFDTSPQSLVELKKEGVPDSVLDAMLSAAERNDKEVASEAGSRAAEATLQKAISAMGEPKAIAALRSLRVKQDVLQSSQGRSITAKRETTRVIPDRIFVTATAQTGQSIIEVITPDFNYKQSGKMTVTLAPDELDQVRQQMRFDPIYVAQHPKDFVATYVGKERMGNVAADVLKLENSGKDVLWKIDAQTGQLLSSTLRKPSGDSVTQFSDFRDVDGVNYPFKQHVQEPGRTLDTSVEEVEFNPAIDDKIFQRSNEAPIQSLTLKVLQAESVPYIQQSGGGISTSCTISGTATASATATTIGNTTFGTGTGNSNTRMNCNSYDTTIRWPHVLNAMLVEGSDGNAYIIACDRAWRWSKCVPLHAGDSFSARFTENGIQVQGVSAKGKAEEPVFRILQSKSLR